MSYDLYLSYPHFGDNYLIGVDNLVKCGQPGAAIVDALLSN